MAITYILRCADNRYYVGSTTNLQQRISQHAHGKCKFTKSRLPVSIALIEEYQSYKDARKREFQIKGHKSRKYIEKLIQLASGSIV